MIIEATLQVPVVKSVLEVSFTLLVYFILVFLFACFILFIVLLFFCFIKTYREQFSIISFREGSLLTKKRF
jgi:TM2 domain-containing membrane protein YozV